MFRSLTITVLLFIALPSAGQICGRAAGSPTEMRVQITVEENTGPSHPTGGDVTNDASHRSGAGVSGEHRQEFANNLQIRVQLQDGYGADVSESQPNSEGQVVFHVCSRFTYRIRVTAPDYEEATADNLQAQFGDRIVNIALHRKGQSPNATDKKPISASRLKVPKNAEKAFDKANVSLAKGDLDAARTEYETAVRLYPDYDQAYNNLGVALMKQGKRSAGKAAFEQAVTINSHFARAFSNLAKIALDDKDYAKSLELVRKSLATEPLNPGTLLVGAEAAYFSGTYAESVSYTRRLHSLPHAGMGVAHYLCGKSLEKQNLLPEALAEYQTFLTEDPADPNVASAQMAIQGLRSATSAQSIN